MIYTLTLNPAIDHELTVTEMRFDSVLTAVHSRVDVGGKGFNVSRMLRSLGTCSTALGFIGGQSGELLRKGLHEFNIPTDFVAIDPGETRTNVSIVTTCGNTTGNTEQQQQHLGQYIKVNEKGPHVDQDKQRLLLSKIESLARPGDCWVLAGSLPLGVADSFYADIIARLHMRQAIAILDTTGECLRLGCQARPFLIKPNAEETYALTGLPVDTVPQIILAASALRSMGAQNVIVSRGKHGAILHTTDGSTCSVASPSIQEGNPIGAGDSMLAGVVWAWTQGWRLKDALRWGAACGAATASLGGTQFPSNDYIQTLFQQVTSQDIPESDAAPAAETDNGNNSAELKNSTQQFATE